MAGSASLDSVPSAGVVVRGCLPSREQRSVRRLVVICEGRRQGRRGLPGGRPQRLSGSC